MAECVFCGVDAKDERDHIPPKSLFPEPRSHDLITVPACRSCNGGRSSEDAWFKNLLLSRADVGDTAAAKALLPGVFRAWSRPENRRETDKLIRSLLRVRLTTPSGLDLGVAPAFSVDIARFSSYVERLLRGLYFHEHRVRLSPGASVAVDATYTPDAALREEAIPFLIGRPVRKTGLGLFKYRFAAVEADPETGVWLLEFYERVPVLIITIGESSRERFEASA